MTNDLRIELRFKNAVLARALEEHFGEAARLAKKGPILPLVSVAAKAIGVHKNLLSRLLNLKESPRGRFSKRDEISPNPSAKKIADRLAMHFEELFPEALYRGTFKNGRTTEMPAIKLLGLGRAARQIGPVDLEAELEHADSVEKLKVAMISTLNPREQKMLEMRFGINGYQEHTLKQIGDYFEITHERVRQIEAGCLRKLRSLPYSLTLRKLLPENYDPAS